MLYYSGMILDSLFSNFKHYNYIIDNHNIIIIAVLLFRDNNTVMIDKKKYNDNNNIQKNEVKFYEFELVFKSSCFCIQPPHLLPIFYYFCVGNFIIFIYHGPNPRK